jgi:hypothetical protein
MISQTGLARIARTRLDCIGRSPAIKWNTGKQEGEAANADAPGHKGPIIIRTA